MRYITARRLVWIFVAILILLIFFATQLRLFAAEMQGNEAIAYIVLLLFIGGFYELWQWQKSRSKSYRFAFWLGFVGLLLLGWVSGAVGIIGSENNPVNLMYWVVPVVMFIGSFISRFKSQGMVFTLLVTAVVQFSVPIVALLISRDVSWGNAGVLGVFIVNTFFALMFAGSGFLFLCAHKSEK